MNYLYKYFKQARVICFSITLAISFLLFFIAHAQDTIHQWESPTKITNSGNFAPQPFMVSDSSGVLHAIWSEGVLVQNDQRTDTIYYASWDGNRWSRPLDIYAVPEGGRAVSTRIRIDQHGYLHAMWVSNIDGLVYAKKHISQSNDFRSWKMTFFPESAWVGDLAISPDGNKIFIIYSQDQSGLYLIRSLDDGNNWSSPINIWESTEGNDTIDRSRIEMSKDGILHVAWDVMTAERQWNPDSVGYARSLDDGSTWQDYKIIQEPSSQVSIGFDEDGAMHLFWNNTATDPNGRFHMLSRDNGFTWSPMERIFIGYRGLTKLGAFAQDGDGILHLIFAANPPDQGTPSIFHTYWDKTYWHEPELISGDLIKTEGPAVAIIAGKNIHALWFTYEQNDWGIWHTWTTIQASSLELQTIPTPQYTPIAELSNSIYEKKTPPSEARQENVVFDNINDAYQETKTSPIIPTVAGIIAATLFIVIVVILNKRR